MFTDHWLHSQPILAGKRNWEEKRNKRYIILSEHYENITGWLLNSLQCCFGKHSVSDLALKVVRKGEKCNSRIEYTKSITYNNKLIVALKNQLLLGKASTSSSSPWRWVLLIRLLDKNLFITFYLSLVTCLPVTKEVSARRRHYEMRFHGWTQQTENPLRDISHGAIWRPFGLTEMHRQILSARFIR